MAIEHTIEHSVDGYNGLIDWLGTNKATEAFSNPHGRGLVTATQISDQSASLTADKALDHATTTTSSRSHTTAVDGAWWQIDFGAGKSVGVRRIGIIGQSSASNHPRYFVVLGANDDGVWHELAVAVNEGPTNASWWSVAVTNDSPFRYIKILSTRNPSDSGGNRYLVLGDVEIWGDYHNTAAPEAEEVVFVAESGHGWRGFFEWLGQNQVAGAWAHPETSRALVVTSMSTEQATYESYGCLDHSFSDASSAHSQDTPNSWWKVDVGEGNTFRLDAMALYGRSANNLRNFRVEGSLDDTAWDELYDVPDGSTGPTPAAWSLYEMDTAPRGYRYFRITMYGYNSDGAGIGEDYLAIGALEFYGESNPLGSGGAGNLMLMGIG